MKLTVATLLLSAFATVSALDAVKANMKFLQSVRRLDQNQEDEYAFLANYKLKLIQCKSGEKYVSPEDGEYEYSSVIFRLCPTTEECNNEGTTGCKAGYGDYIVGLNSFVEMYLEAKREEMEANADDNFDLEYNECREFKADNDANNGNDEEERMYYVGPACADDGTDVKLGFFTDETCTTESSDVSFEDIANGLSLPYSTGGLISNYCESCYAANDNGEMELSEMCERLYAMSGKCETNMEAYHYSGKSESSCESISALMPKVKKSGAGKAFGWIFFVLVVVGVAFAAFTFLKKKRAASSDDKNFGLMNA